jgi:hypothetical protein
MFRLLVNKYGADPAPLNRFGASSFGETIFAVRLDTLDAMMCHGAMVCVLIRTNFIRAMTILHV